MRSGSCQTDHANICGQQLYLDTESHSQCDYDHGVDHNHDDENDDENDHDADHDGDHGDDHDAHHDQDGDVDVHDADVNDRHLRRLKRNKKEWRRSK